MKANYKIPILKRGEHVSMKANHKIATLKRRAQEVQEILFIIA
jgi:hypothetical protein